MLLIYQGIAAVMALLLVAAMFRPRPVAEQVTAAIVLVPLLLRVFLIK
jgi:hypothetical protein